MPYNANMSKTGLVPANHLWHLETTGEVMLAEWPESLEERAINESAVALAQHAEEQHFTELSPNELQAKTGEVVASHGFKAEFQKMWLSPTVVSAVEHLNTNRKGKPAYSYSHIQQGYRGGFFKYVQGETPVMKADGVKDLLALFFFCLRQEKACVSGSLRGKVVKKKGPKRKRPIQRQLGGCGS